MFPIYCDLNPVCPELQVYASTVKFSVVHSVLLRCLQDSGGVHPVFSSFLSREPQQRFLTPVRFPNLRGSQLQQTKYPTRYQYLTSVRLPRRPSRPSLTLGENPVKKLTGPVLGPRGQDRSKLSGPVRGPRSPVSVLQKGLYTPEHMDCFWKDRSSILLVKRVDLSISIDSR